jgi:hypothetical protein
VIEKRVSRRRDEVAISGDYVEVAIGAPVGNSGKVNADQIVRGAAPYVRIDFEHRYLDRMIAALLRAKELLDAEGSA